MKICKKFIACSLALFLGLSISACDDTTKADSDIFTNKFEVLLERSDNIDAEYMLLDQISNDLLEEYKSLDQDYLQLQAQNKLDTEEALALLSRKKEINLKLKDIIAKIKILKTEQEDIRVQLESFDD